MHPLQSPECAAVQYLSQWISQLPIYSIFYNESISSVLHIFSNTFILVRVAVDLEPILDSKAGVHPGRTMELGTLHTHTFHNYGLWCEHGVANSVLACFREYERIWEKLYTDSKSSLGSIPGPCSWQTSTWPTAAPCHLLVKLFLLTIQEHNTTIWKLLVNKQNE